MKRRGFLASVNQLVADARIDALDPSTAETVRFIESLSNLHGKNPQPGGQDAGFLRDWWGTFWSMYSTRLPLAGFVPSAAAAPPSAKPRASPLGMPPINSPTYPPPQPSQPQSSQPSPSQQPSASPTAPGQSSVSPHGTAAAANAGGESQPGRRKKIVLAAMQSLGMGGRDPQSLTLEEQRLVSFTIQQQLAAQRAAGLAALPPPMHHYMLSGQAPPAAAFPTPLVPLPGTTTPVAEPTAKRKKPIALDQASAAVQQGLPPGMTPQQIMQMRSLQLQQQQLQLQLQQQQMMMLMSGAPAMGLAGGRPIMPGPTPASTPSRRSPNLAGGLSLGSGGAAEPSGRSNSSVASGARSGAESAAFLGPPTAAAAGNAPTKDGQMHHPDMDESALLSFFGTPADWFSPTVSESAAAAAGMASSPYGAFGPTGVDGSAHSKAPPPPPLLRVDGHVEAESGGGGGGDSSCGSTSLSFATTPLESPQPLPATDPNDLLQLSEQAEAPAAGQISTKAGRYLQALSELGHHAAGSKAVSTCISHDGQLMASGGHDRRVLLFSLPQRRELFCLEGHHTQQITQVRFAPTGSRRLLATASFDHTVHLWDLGPAALHDDGSAAAPPPSPPPRPESPRLILRDVHDEPVWSIDFIPCGSDPDGPLRLGSIDASGKLVIWDLETGIALHTTLIKSKDDWAVTVRQIKARPSLPALGGASILAIANGSYVELFDCDRMEMVSSLLVSAPLGEQKGKSVVSLSWGYTERPGHLLAATSETVALWDLQAHLQDLTVPPTVLATTHVPADKITGATLLRDLPCVLISGYQALYLWEIGTAAERSRPVKFPAHQGLVASISVTRRGPLLIGSVAHDGSVLLWQADTVPIGCSASDIDDDPDDGQSSELESSASASLGDENQPQQQPRRPSGPDTDSKPAMLRIESGTGTGSDPPISHQTAP